MRIAVAFALALSLGVGVAPLSAQERRDIQLSHGSDRETFRGTVTGGDNVDYTVAARRGQTMTVTLNSRDTVYFNILPPNSRGEAIFTGSVSGGEFRDSLSEEGTYTIRVYQMGAAAQEGRRSSYEIGVRVE